MLLPDWWKDIFARIGVNKNGNIFISGTVNTVNKTLVFGDSYEIEIHDPIRKKTISHAYNVEIMPQGIE